MSGASFDPGRIVTARDKSTVGSHGDGRGERNRSSTAYSSRPFWLTITVDVLSFTHLQFGSRRAVACTVLDEMIRASKIRLFSVRVEGVRCDRGLMAQPMKDENHAQTSAKDMA